MFENLKKGLEISLIRDDRWKLYLEGLKNTILLAAIACIIGIIIGVFVAIIKYYYAQQRAGEKKSLLLSILNTVTSIYTTVIRGTPVMIQLLILYAIFFKEGYEAAIVGFGLNSGAYVSEIIRSGLMSVDKGQAEAGRSLGLSQNQTMLLIVMPQAIKNILPALFNEFISLLKETSVAGYVAVRELTKSADLVKGRTMRSEPLFIAAIIYLVLVISLTSLQRVLERRLAKSDRS